MNEYWQNKDKIELQKYLVNLDISQLLQLVKDKSITMQDLGEAGRVKIAKRKGKRIREITSDTWFNEWLAQRYNKQKFRRDWDS
jgi:hypothetical protein